MQPLSKRTKGMNALVIICTWAIVFGCALIKSLLIDKAETTLRFALTFVGYAFLSLTLLIVMMVYLGRFRRKILISPKLSATLYGVMAVSFVINTFLSSIHPFLMPITLASMMASTFFDSRVGFVCNTFSVILHMLSGVAFGCAFDGGFDFDFTAIAVLLSGFLVGTLITFAMGRDTKRISFVVIGVAMGVFGLLLIIMFSLFSKSIVTIPAKDYAYFASFIFAPIVLSLVLLPIMERVFNVTSNFRLLELTDPRHPLMKKLAAEAPGTFNHCLTVSNLVETCATAIGENVYMARAASYYHDVGKLKNPSMFVENQIDGHNIHDELTPEASTDIIRKHTVYGYQFCKQNRIPEEVAMIALEHHGTNAIQFFYNKAKDLTDGREVDVKDFCYGGPVPSTKISALVMICDACEAAIRSMKKPVAAEVDKLVENVISSRLKSGQFDNSPITMQDLSVTRKTIVNAVCGLYHQRIQYPKADNE